jgi:hypothetical protein
MTSPTSPSSPPSGTADVDLVDLAECELPDDEHLEPGGGPRSAIAARIQRAQ